MQPITVAVVEIDQDERLTLEKIGCQNEPDIKLLTDKQSNHDDNVERRLVSRNNITSIDNAIARIKRLNPRVLLVNANKSIDECRDLLLALRQECPRVHAILIINEIAEESYLLEMLASGARGFIPNNTDSLDLSKIVKAIDRGEAWISRKMIGKIMQEIVSASHCNPSEGDFDSPR